MRPVNTPPGGKPPACTRCQPLNKCNVLRTGASLLLLPGNLRPDIEQWTIAASESNPRLYSRRMCLWALGGPATHRGLAPAGRAPSSRALPGPLIRSHWKKATETARKIYIAVESSFNDGTTQTARDLPLRQPVRTHRYTITILRDDSTSKSFKSSMVVYFIAVPSRLKGCAGACCKGQSVSGRQQSSPVACRHRRRSWAGAASTDNGPAGPCPPHTVPTLKWQSRRGGSWRRGLILIFFKLGSLLSYKLECDQNS